jgi:hypothetical protein
MPESPENKAQELNLKDNEDRTKESWTKKKVRQTRRYKSKTLTKP